MPGPYHGWLAIRDRTGRAYEVFNHARLAKYLQSFGSAINGLDPCSILDLGGCANYSYFPDCTVDVGYLDLPGTSGNYASTPDAAALDITGDLSIAALIAPDDWTPATSSMIVTKDGTGANDHSYSLRLLGSGALNLVWSPDGTTASQISVASTANLSALANGAKKWVGATLDVVNGANRVLKFWQSDNGVNWTQLGATITTAGTTSIGAGAAALMIGAFGAGTSNLLGGNYYYVRVANGIGSNTDPIQGTTAFLFDGAKNLDGLATGATSFTASSGQTVTVNRSGTPSSAVVASTYGTWVAKTYVSPTADPAPWYNAAYPESANAYGFMLEEWTGLDDTHITRSSTPWGGYGGGTLLGAASATGRTMAINMMLFGASEEAVDYLFRWLGSTFNAVCATCDTDTMLIRRYCGSTANPEAGVAELRRVGVNRGLSWESDIADWGNCQIRRASIILEAGDPCMYLPEAAPTVTSSTITNLNACFNDVDVTVNAARSICRPTCSELETTCRSTYSWTVTPMAAVGPIIVFDNPASQLSYPFRATVYADPNAVGASNPCGLEIIGQIYVRALPPWSTMTWDVAGREVRYRDASTGGDVATSTYLEPNDPPNRRYFAQGCAQAHLVVEPATLCATSLGSNQWETGGVTFSSPVFPTVTITTQERISCP